VLSLIKTIETINPVVRPASNTFPEPVGISVEFASLIAFFETAGDGVAVWDCVGVADGEAEALGLAVGETEALGLADCVGLGVELFTGSGTPLPQTSLPLFFTHVNF
jgi:hypothetical protein